MHVSVVQPPSAGPDRVGRSDLLHGRLDSLRVGLGVDETERVGGPKARVELLQKPVIQEQGDVLIGGDAEMVSAFRTHMGVLAEPPLVEDLATAIAFDPNIRCQLALLRDELLLGLLEPGHSGSSRFAPEYTCWRTKLRSPRQLSTDTRMTMASPTNRESRKLPP